MFNKRDSKADCRFRMVRRLREEILLYIVIRRRRPRLDPCRTPSLTSRTLNLEPLEAAQKK